MMDELVIEEMSTRAVQEKMDEAFRFAMQRAINAGGRTRRDGCLEEAGYSKPEGCIVLIVAATHDPSRSETGDRAIALRHSFLVSRFSAGRALRVLDLEQIVARRLRPSRRHPR